MGKMVFSDDLMDRAVDLFHHAALLCMPMNAAQVGSELGISYGAAAAICNQLMSEDCLEVCIPLMHKGRAKSPRYFMLASHFGELTEDVELERALRAVKRYGQVKMSSLYRDGWHITDVSS